MKDTFRLCRKCGRPIGVISAKLYRNIIVDAEVEMVVPYAKGDIYVRIDGSKMRGRPALEDETGSPAYRPHHCHEV